LAKIPVEYGVTDILKMLNNREMKDKLIEKLSSKHNDYFIKINNNGFYCEVKSRNKFKLFKEYINDWLGNTYNHPIFLSALYVQNIESMRNLINIQIKLENK